MPGFKGAVLRPDDEGYDDARRVFSGMIDRRPAVIARCSDDVAVVVNLARENDLPLSVYGGGHSVTGSAVVDAGICADLRDNWPDPADNERNIAYTCAIARP